VAAKSPALGLLVDHAPDRGREAHAHVGGDRLQRGSVARRETEGRDWRSRHKTVYTIFGRTDP
jgi:hypothetical protein